MTELWILLVVLVLAAGLARRLFARGSPRLEGAGPLVTDDEVDDAYEGALAFVAGRRGWEHHGDHVHGSGAGRAIELRVVDASGDLFARAATRIAIQLTHPHARALDGLTNRDGPVDWTQIYERPPAEGYPSTLPLRSLPRAFRARLGRDSFEWLLETSARVVLANGWLYVDHPDVILDGETLGEIVDGVVEHATRLDESLEDLLDSLCEAEDGEREAALALLAERFPESGQAMKAALLWLHDPEPPAEQPGVVDEAGGLTVAEAPVQSALKSESRE